MCDLQSVSNNSLQHAGLAVNVMLDLWLLQVKLTDSSADYLLLRREAADYLPPAGSELNETHLLAVLHLVVAVYQTKTTQHLQDRGGKVFSQSSAYH